MNRKIIFLFLVVINTNLFSCGCNEVIITTNYLIKESISKYLSGVESSIDSLNTQLDENLKEIKNRTVVANDEYYNSLKSILAPLGIKNLKNEPIEGFLMKIRISPVGSESMKLNQFLFEYKKIIQLKVLEGVEYEKK